MNLADPFRRAAALTPDAPAIIRADGSAISRARLDRLIDAFAARAAALGLRAGDVAGLAITGPDESLGLILALALARIGVASADPGYAGARLRFAAGEAGAVPYDASWLAAPADTPPMPAHDDPASVFRVFASSGTTGLPKYAAVTHAMMARRVFAGVLALGGAPAVRIVAVNLGITLGLTAVLRTLWLGGTLVLSNPAEAWDAIARHGVTEMLLSPVAARALLAAMPAGAAPPATLRRVEVSGARLAPPLRAEMQARLCPDLVNWLGATEAGGIAAAPFAALPDRPGAVGYLLPGITAQAVDDAHRPLPPGTQGLLRLRGDTVVQGYLGAAAGEAFRDDWFYPGDIGTVWPDGLLCLAGRAGDVINAGGVKHSAQAIEEALLTLPLVTDAAAFGVPDEAGIEQIWVAIVARATIETGVLNAFCNRALPGRVPKMIVQMPALPRNANGKVRKDLLLAFARGGARPE